MYTTKTDSYVILHELQQQRLQVCENNWVRKIARVRRADRRRMVELREEMGVQRSLTERLPLVRSRLQWAGHVERMADDRLSVSIRILHVCIDLSRKRSRDSYRDAVCKQIATLCNKNRQPAAQNQNRSLGLTSCGATVRLDLRLYWRLTRLIVIRAPPETKSPGFWKFNGKR